MPADPAGLCVVEVGPHGAPYWRRLGDGAVLCDRHRGQMDEYHAGEYPDQPPLRWEPLRLTLEQAVGQAVCAAGALAGNASQFLAALERAGYEVRRTPPGIPVTIHVDPPQGRHCPACGYPLGVG